MAESQTALMWRWEPCPPRSMSQRSGPRWRTSSPRVLGSMCFLIVPVDFCQSRCGDYTEACKLESDHPHLHLGVFMIFSVSLSLSASLFWAGPVSLNSFFQNTKHAQVSTLL